MKVLLSPAHSKCIHFDLADHSIACSAADYLGSFKEMVDTFQRNAASAAAADAGQDTTTTADVGAVNTNPAPVSPSVVGNAGQTVAAAVRTYMHLHERCALS